MSLMLSTPADAERRRRLRVMRGVALSLLILAAAIFVATLRLDHSGIWGYVNTGAEAAMVGALADWFAVTALFRHPLGLPIPHTAIIPKRKNEIGRNLQEFVTENFLTEEIARERLAAAHVADRVGTWLGMPANRHRAMVEVVRVLEQTDGRYVLDVRPVAGEVDVNIDSPHVVALHIRSGTPATPWTARGEGARYIFDELRHGCTRMLLIRLPAGSPEILVGDWLAEPP